ncbi:MAG: hypothetical protein CMQ05_17115 [Gammaproteobacteria bacterium]|uniref:Uncharacterized protein n=1 Tax=OM182 bacterium MED-G24 TaxID=1986255 RepID=A0A2A5X0P7_9GAMM|nr:hypothetical protein [Gammaproteobacteria bacterium]PDH42168.1 MAG: hypothetical protein CNE99_00160 [OM182 bacterium MED-G24]RPG23223.1 MAG: hypothetical protein CBC10_016085 [Gammaproteobacteria bacterium TMED50]
MVTDPSALHRRGGFPENSLLDHEPSDTATVESMSGHYMMAADAENMAPGLLTHCGGIRGLLTISPSQVPRHVVMAATVVQTVV